MRLPENFPSVLTGLFGLIAGILLPPPIFRSRSNFGPSPRARKSARTCAPANLPADNQAMQSATEEQDKNDDAAASVATATATSTCNVYPQRPTTCNWRHQV